MSLDHKIGIVYSPGPGAGWSTWGDADQALDQELALAIHNERPYSEIKEIANTNWPTAYTEGLKKAVVQWVDRGTIFKINCRSGSESIEYSDPDDTWLMAR